MTGFPPDHPGAEVRASPNFGPRRDGKRVTILLMHYTGMEDGPSAENLLCSSESEVSAHYVLHEDGRVVQMVRESDRAWHAGASFWAGETDINSCSIGIEVVNPGHTGGLPDFPERQIRALIGLSRGIIARHGIEPHGVLAHSDVAPGRKIDPGERFPWARLAAAGIGHFAEPEPLSDGPALWPGDEGKAVEELQSMLTLYGYGVEITGSYDERTRIVVEGFQRHFRPAAVDGIADTSTVKTLKRLLDARRDIDA